MAHKIRPGLIIGILWYPSIFRGLDGLLERPLSVLSARIHRSYPSEGQRLSDLDVLLRLISQQRQYCETLSFWTFYEEASIGTIANNQATPIFCAMSKHLMVRRMGPIVALSKSAHSRPPPPPPPSI